MVPSTARVFTQSNKTNHEAIVLHYQATCKTTTNNDGNLSAFLTKLTKYEVAHSVADSG